MDKSTKIFHLLTYKDKKNQFNPQSVAILCIFSLRDDEDMSVN